LIICLILRQSFSVQSRLASNMRSSCLIESWVLGLQAWSTTPIIYLFVYLHCWGLKPWHCTW
jgi:hypothetical protein